MRPTRAESPPGSGPRGRRTPGQRRTGWRSSVTSRFVGRGRQPVRKITRRRRDLAAGLGPGRNNWGPMSIPIRAVRRQNREHPTVRCGCPGRPNDDLHDQQRHGILDRAVTAAARGDDRARRAREHARRDVRGEPRARRLHRGGRRATPRGRRADDTRHDLPHRVDDQAHGRGGGDDAGRGRGSGARRAGRSLAPGAREPAGAEAHRRAARGHRPGEASHHGARCPHLSDGLRDRLGTAERPAHPARCQRASPRRLRASAGAGAAGTRRVDAALLHAAAHASTGRGLSVQHVRRGAGRPPRARVGTTVRRADARAPLRAARHEGHRLLGPRRPGAAPGDELRREPGNRRARPLRSGRGEATGHARPPSARPGPASSPPSTIASPSRR